MEQILEHVDTIYLHSDVKDEKEKKKKGTCDICHKKVPDQTELNNRIGNNSNAATNYKKSLQDYIYHSSNSICAPAPTSLYSYSRNVPNHYLSQYRDSLFLSFSAEAENFIRKAWFETMLS